MKKELKLAIVSFIFNNEGNFQLHNATTKEFKEYIFSSSGNYLIGGEDVNKFIEEAINLITKN